MPWLLIAVVILLAGGSYFLLARQRRAFAGELERQRKAADTLREEHSRSLARELAHQQALFDSMTEGVLLLDAGVRVRLVNEAFLRLFGVTGDVRGHTVMEALRLHQVQELADRILVDGRVENAELNLPGVDGDRFIAVNGSVVLGTDGQRQGLILVFHDLTRLKQLENTRQEFVANVSHELRTPLSLIKGYVETLIDGAASDSAVAGKFLRTIEHHADRLAFLIEDLLTISRLESGQMVINLQPADLRETAAAVISDLNSRAASRSVQLANDVPPRLTADADADRLQQALFNLVDNAIKYGRTDGRVSVSARPAEAGFIEVCVRDDGPGIPEHAQARVFERFFRVDKARSRDAGGTGLGLAIVKHIIQAHGGEVRVESAEGQGAAFIFSLRSAQKSANSP